MPKPLNLDDLVGKQFGRLVITSTHRKEGAKGQIRAICVCVCGKEWEGNYHALRSGYTRSCGCLHHETVQSKPITHGMRQTHVWHVWAQIKQRCCNPLNKGYKNYGGRGIGLCEKWMRFEGFLEDMGIPGAGLTIERVDNNKGYCKDNCIWADRTTQANNKRGNVLITYLGQTKTMTQWGKELGISGKILSDRVGKLGWSVEKALSTGKLVNQHGNGLITYQGESKTMAQWGRDLGLNEGVLSDRMGKLGWSVEKALSTGKITNHRGKKDVR